MIDQFKGADRGWQTRIDGALRERIGKQDVTYDNALHSDHPTVRARRIWWAIVSSLRTRECMEHAGK